MATVGVKGLTSTSKLFHSSAASNWLPRQDAMLH